jgi:hypothetical protein
VKWRLLEAPGVPISPWIVAVDFRTFRMNATLFSDIYAPGTRQNAPGLPGRDLVYLVHGFDSTRLQGTYEVEVSASDSAGNTTVKKVRLVIADQDS